MKLLGLFEQVHQLQVTCAKFAGSKVLITAGTDCAVSAWNIFSTAKAIDLQPKGTLYGHLSPVYILEISEAFSTLLSASSDGVIFLWDLNRLNFVRELSYAGKSLQVSCEQSYSVSSFDYKIREKADKVIVTVCSN